MKPNDIVIHLALISIPLALLAAGAGVFWQGSGEPYPFDTLRGETVMIRGYGLYRFDTVNSSSQEIGTDIVTLVIGIPLLITGIVLSRKGTLRGQLLLTGALGYFLYTYGAMCFLTAFNPFFLVYVALFSLSLLGFEAQVRVAGKRSLRVTCFETEAGWYGVSIFGGYLCKPLVRAVLTHYTGAV